MTTTEPEILIIRRRLGWNQQRMADALGVRQSSVSRWETGALEVSATALRLARTFLPVSADATPDQTEGEPA